MKHIGMKNNYLFKIDQWLEGEWQNKLQDLDDQ